MQKNENKHYLTPYTGISSKCIKDPNIRPKTTNLPEENTSEKLPGTGLETTNLPEENTTEKLPGTGLGDDILDLTP